MDKYDITDYLKDDKELQKAVIEEFLKEIAELKAENENLRLALKTYEMPEVVKVLTDWRTGELDNIKAEEE